MTLPSFVLKFPSKLHLSHFLLMSLSPCSYFPESARAWWRIQESSSSGKLLASAKAHPNIQVCALACLVVENPGRSSARSRGGGGSALPAQHIQHIFPTAFRPSRTPLVHPITDQFCPNTGVVNDDGCLWGASAMIVSELWGSAVARVFNFPIHWLLNMQPDTICATRFCTMA